MTATGGTSDPVIVKKYGNRRLYDTNQSRYITLEELASIVQKGATVRVMEASTDRDLTRQVLTQVILEMQAPLDLIPVELLHAILRVQGTLDQAPFTAALAVVTRQLAEQGGLWAQQLAAMIGAVPGFPGAPRPPSPAPTAAPGPIPGEAADPPEPAPDGDLTDLRARMNALLERMNRR